MSTIIHRYWTGPDEPEVESLPGQRIWHDEDLPPELVEWIEARLAVGQVREDDIPRHRSNMVRLWLLAHHGGIWLDHDAHPLGVLFPGIWIASDPTRTHAVSCAIALPADHPLAWMTLSHIEKQPPSDRSSVEVSGSGPLTIYSNWLRVPKRPISDDWLKHDRATSQYRRKR